MTLQQKILAKNSKKGFTLVELVVVIAILAILAAIAIPMVTSIISSATNSARESEAASLNTACKTFQAGLASGSINSSNIGAGTYSITPPARTASQAAKNTAANAATVNDAATYNGLLTLMTNIADFGYINGGTGEATIVYVNTTTGATALTSGTALSAIYGNVT